MFCLINIKLQNFEILYIHFSIQANALKITTSTPEMNKLAHSLSRLAGDDTVWTDNDGSFIRRRRINL